MMPVLLVLSLVCCSNIVPVLAVDFDYSGFSEKLYDRVEELYYASNFKSSKDSSLLSKVYGLVRSIADPSMASLMDFVTAILSNDKDTLGLSKALVDFPYSRSFNCFEDQAQCYLGKKLGSGGFGSVYLVRVLFKHPSDADYSDSELAVLNREQLLRNAIKHQKPELMEIGLKSLWDMNDLISNNTAVCTEFYVNFYCNITKEILFVMTDCRHLSGFKLQG